MELDIIFTYVDNECKNWLNERNKFLSKYNKNYENNRHNSNLNEIKYAIRSIDKYFHNKYRNIYFVTNNGKLPSFIKPNPNFIPIHYKTLLGTTSFNSNTIETSLHKIEGLSEYYLYFNDDMILLDYLNMDDLISNDGKLIWYKESNMIINFVNNNPIITKLFDLLDSGTNNARHSTYNLLNLKEIPAPISHSPKIFSKTLVNDFCRSFNSQIDYQKNNIFRSENDFCFIDGFGHYYTNLNKIIFSDLYSTNIMCQFDNIFLSKLYNKIDNSKFLCVEDIRKEYNVDVHILNILEELFPLKSKYEF